MKLYRVDFSGECYVLAEDEHEACRIAVEAVRVEPDAAGLDRDAFEVEKGEFVPNGWWDAHPYHAPLAQVGGKTVSELVEAMGVDHG